MIGIILQLKNMNTLHNAWQPMNKKIFLIMSIFSIFVINVDNCATAQSQISYPKLTFKYDWRSYLIDAVGRLYFKTTVNAGYRNQLTKQLPLFTKVWQQNAPLLFNEIFSVFKRGFKQNKRTAIVYLSHNASYGSKRFLVLGLRYYLDSESWNLAATRQDVFVDLVFHELLHVWVDENIGDKSQLLAKYRNEHQDVREHLHLMALQKMVYLKINRPDMLAMIDHSYRTLASPEYRRAWEILNDIEGYEIVINDIFDLFKKSDIVRTLES